MRASVAVQPTAGKRRSGRAAPEIVLVVDVAPRDLGVQYGEVTAPCAPSAVVKANRGDRPVRQVDDGVGKGAEFPALIKPETRNDAGDRFAGPPGRRGVKQK